MIGKPIAPLAGPINASTVDPKYDGPNKYLANAPKANARNIAEIASTIVMTCRCWQLLCAVWYSEIFINSNGTNEEAIYVIRALVQILEKICSRKKLSACKPWIAGHHLSQPSRITSE